MKKTFAFYLFSLLLLFVLNLSVKAESIHFDEFVYKFKDAKIEENILTNGYYKPKENSDYWTSRFIVSELKNEKSPIKFATEKDNSIEQNKNCILLKFIQNKKQNIAIISYLENFNHNEKIFFIYRITKFEKSPTNGISTISFEKKYILNTQNDAEKMAKQIKSKNNDYMERMIITDIPEIIIE
jgi:hypothetical protein